MKNLLFSTSLLFICLFLSCAKKEYTARVAAGRSNGVFTADFNRNTDWEASALAIDADSAGLIHVHCTAYFDNPEFGLIQNESLVFGSIPRKTGRYHLSKNVPGGGYAQTVRLHIFASVDAGGDGYHPRPNQQNWLEVSQIDTIAGYMRGEFNLHLAVEDEDEMEAPWNPAKVSLTNGMFEVKLPE